MKNLWKLTKEQLITECKKLQSENERLQDELDMLSDSYSEMENDLADMANSLDVADTIKDVDCFKFRLQHCGLLTSELESFIEDYLKFNNV